MVRSKEKLIEFLQEFDKYIYGTKLDYSDNDRDSILNYIRRFHGHAEPTMISIDLYDIAKILKAQERYIKDHLYIEKKIETLEEIEETLSMSESPYI